MKDFTHVDNFTGYMRVVADFVTQNGKAGQSVLDVPAGNGLLGDELKAKGFAVTCADINSERLEYVYANMEKPLPFADGQFDFAICMEGIEHVINPHQLASELTRIIKPGGHIVISMPNVQCLYSRLKFLFTGIFYQFEPEFTRHPGGALVDRGHISALSYIQLNYLFREANAKPVYISGDKIKKKILFPLYAILWIINIIYFSIKEKRATQPELNEQYALMKNTHLQLSRSMVAVWQKI